LNKYVLCEGNKQQQFEFSQAKHQTY